MDSPGQSTLLAAHYWLEGPHSPGAASPSRQTQQQQHQVHVDMLTAAAAVSANGSSGTSSRQEAARRRRPAYARGTERRAAAVRASGERKKCSDDDDADDGGIYSISRAPVQPLRQSVVFVIDVCLRIDQFCGGVYSYDSFYCDDDEYLRFPLLSHSACFVVLTTARQSRRPLKLFHLFVHQDVGPPSSCNGGSAFECAICLDQYNEHTALPELVQPCGHTFCQPCLRRHRNMRTGSAVATATNSAASSTSVVVRCPICRTVISGCAVNRALLAALPRSRCQSENTRELEQANLILRKQVLRRELQTCIDREASATQAAARAAEDAADAATAVQAAEERAERAREEKRILAAEAKEEREARMLVESSLREVEDLLNRRQMAKNFR